MTTTRNTNRSRHNGVEGRSTRQSSNGSVGKPEPPEYLEADQVKAIIQRAHSPRSKMLMLLMWRGALRISEACALDFSDVELTGDRPTLRVRRGKGHKTRVVPLHGELGDAVRAYRDFGERITGPIVDAHRTTGWEWLKKAVAAAESAGEIPRGRKITPHTFRHSAARHWLANGDPINVVSRWLGHSNLQTTLIYLQILPDPTGLMDEIP